MIEHDREPVSEIVVSLGSNFGDRSRNVKAAMQWLKTLSEHYECSLIYETPEIHGKGAPYMNAVAAATTTLDYETLQHLMKNYERSCGRDEKHRVKGEVPIDIDIVVWNSEVVRPLDFSREFFKIGYAQIAHQNLAARR